MFRRPIRRGVRRMTVGAINQNEFFRANRLFAAAQYEPAANEFTHLAQRMERIGKPRQAANLHAQAALAWGKAGDEALALTQANLAFTQFTLLGMQKRIVEFKGELKEVLHPTGIPAKTTVGVDPFGEAQHATVNPVADGQRGKLPALCDQCGAPVRSDEVEWIDGFSAECDFCGAILQTE